MLENRSNKKVAARAPILGVKNLPHLSLNLHTMPQTANSHFKKWLFLAILMGCLMVLVTILIFWQ
jgi:hypothetical protein